MNNTVTLKRLGIALAYPLAYAYVRLMTDFNDTFVIDPSGGNGHMNVSDLRHASARMNCSRSSECI